MSNAVLISGSLVGARELIGELERRAVLEIFRDEFAVEGVLLGTGEILRAGGGERIGAHPVVGEVVDEFVEGGVGGRGGSAGEGRGEKENEGRGEEETAKRRHGGKN